MKPTDQPGFDRMTPNEILAWVGGLIGRVAPNKRELKRLLKSAIKTLDSVAHSTYTARHGIK